MNADQAPVATRTTITGTLTASPPAETQPKSLTTRRRSRTPTATTNTAIAPATSSPTLGLDQNANAHAAPAPMSAAAARRRSPRRSYHRSTASSAPSAPRVANDEYELEYATSGEPKASRPEREHDRAGGAETAPAHDHESQDGLQGEARRHHPSQHQQLCAGDRHQPGADPRRERGADVVRVAVEHVAVGESVHQPEHPRLVGPVHRPPEVQRVGHHEDDQEHAAPRDRGAGSRGHDRPFCRGEAAGALQPVSRTAGLPDNRSGRGEWFHAAGADRGRGRGVHRDLHVARHLRQPRRGVGILLEVARRAAPRRRCHPALSSPTPRCRRGRRPGGR